MKHIITNPYHEILRFDKGEEVYQGLLDFCKNQDVRSAWIWGLGATEKLTISFYDINKKEYLSKTFTEPLEVLSMNGNISFKSGPLLHLHGVFGRQDFSTIGGHIKELVALGTIEIFIHKIEGEMTRQFDEKTGLNLMD